MTWPDDYINKIICGDCLEVMKGIPDDVVQCCITSPPYWGLRDYGIEGQLGLEKTPEEYVAKIVEIFREVRRILRKDGTVWLNLGDSYLAQQGAGFNEQRRFNDANLNIKVKRPSWLKPKDLCGIPWRVAFALQANGWWLRQDIIWSKPNPMPESVTDRCTKSHEYLFLLTKSAKYYYDADAIREKADVEKQRSKSVMATIAVGNTSIGDRRINYEKDRHIVEYRNKRSVWTIPTQPYPQAHFATYPIKLVEPCILAGTKVGDIILDPFFGAGTTGLRAKELGRRYIGIDISAEYCKQAEERLKQEELFSTVNKSEVMPMT